MNFVTPSSAKLILISMVLITCFSVAIFEKARPPASLPNRLGGGRPRQTLVLLDVSQALAANDSSNISDDFRKALQVTIRFIDGFLQKAGTKDHFWIVGFANNRSDEQKIFGPFKKNSPELKSLRELILISPGLSAADLKEKISKLTSANLFPRPDSQLDGFQALNRAIEILSTAPDYKISANRIALITSGLFTCQRTLREGYSKFCEEGKTAGCLTSSCQTLFSKKAFDANMLAYRELIEVIGPKLSNSKIELNSYLVGKRVLPHTLLIPSPDKERPECMKVEEMEERNYPRVSWRSFRIPFKDPNEKDFEDTFVGREKGSYYIAPNVLLWSLSKSTSGRFFPVRPPCPPTRYSGYRDLSGDGIWGGIDDVCAWSQTSKSFSNQPQNILKGEESAALRYLVHSQELIDSGVTDTDSRLLCDPGRYSSSTFVPGKAF